MPVPLESFSAAVPQPLSRFPLGCAVTCEFLKPIAGLSSFHFRTFSRRGKMTMPVLETETSSWLHTRCDSTAFSNRPRCTQRSEGFLQNPLSSEGASTAPLEPRSQSPPPSPLSRDSNLITHQAGRALASWPWVLWPLRRLLGCTWGVLLRLRFAAPHLPFSEAHPSHPPLYFFRCVAKRDDSTRLPAFPPIQLVAVAPELGFQADGRPHQTSNRRCSRARPWSLDRGAGLC